ncbi:hypothetical protein [Nostoc sp.]|uniref:hypothetical protein n=1 Tax=Nostoc sp. TaxID=1180 RepID=UPI003FA5A1EC
MRPRNWSPPIKLSALEQSIVKRIKRAKLFTFLKQYRHQLFDQQFQKELSKLYADSAQGYPPVPPTQLALVTILQAYTGASDAKAIEALSMDRRWHGRLHRLRNGSFFPGNTCEISHGINYPRS